MEIPTAVMANANAKHNRGKKADKEKKSLEKRLSDCGDIRVDVTTEPELVKGLCNEYIRDRIRMIILSGGDGTVQEFMTRHFRQLYREFGKGMLPIDFARVMNSMALDSSSGLILPALYHKRRGTLNFYADTFKMRGDIDDIAEQLLYAKGDKNMSARFKRAYAPVFMLYSKDHPNDLENVQLMTAYADGFLFNVFREYYRPKEKGKDSDIFSAAHVVGRTAASIALDKTLPEDNGLGRFYSDRYKDKILTKNRAKVVVDGRTVVDEGEETSVMAIGTMGVSLYGLKPFYRLPRTPEKFLFFDRGKQEKPEDVNIDSYMFQLFVGNPDPLDVVKQLGNIYMGTATEVVGIEDILAKRVEKTQDERMSFIADGTPKYNGRSVVMELAYLQPFVMIDHGCWKKGVGDVLKDRVRREFVGLVERFTDSVAL
ncbi:diacylglycerol kinase family protein [Nanoarchaeota archaeon]